VLAVVAVADALEELGKFPRLSVGESSVDLDGSSSLFFDVLRFDVAKCIIKARPAVAAACSRSP
jgi:hypothetical protein